MKIRLAFLGLFVIFYSRAQNLNNNSRFSSIQKCREKLITYLKDALGENYSGTKEQNGKRQYEICECNTNGAYEAFKNYGKLPPLGKTTIGREKLDIRPGSSVFTNLNKIPSYNPNTNEWEITTVITTLGSSSPFIPVFNKKLNWEEIKNLLTGKLYKGRDGVLRTIDSELVIPGFGEGGLCSSNKFISEYRKKPSEKTNIEMQSEQFNKTKQVQPDIDEFEDFLADSLDFKGKVVAIDSINILNNKYYFKDNLFDGCIIEFYDNGQISNKKQIAKGEINGRIETYYYEEFDPQYFFDSKLSEIMDSQLNQVLNKVTIKSQDSISNEIFLKEFIINSINGYEKLEKLKINYLKGKLKGDQLELFQEYDKLDNKLLSSIYNLSKLRAEVNSLIKDIVKENAKEKYIPLREMVYFEKNKLKNGYYRSFYWNQDLMEKGEYENNLQNGNWKFYFQNGVLKGEGVYKNGNGQEIGISGIPKNGRIGLWKTYYENGNLFQEQNIRENEKVYVSTYFKNGKIQKKGEYEKFDKDLKPLGLHILYDENGNKIQEVDYLSDNRSKVEKSFFRNGQVLSEINYFDSIYHGKVIVYREDGKIEKESTYKFGKLNGLVKSYFPNGNVHFESNFCNNQQQGVLAEYYENGKIKLKANSDTTATLLEDSELRLFGDAFYYNEDGTIKAHYFVNKDGTNTDKLKEEKKLQNSKKKFKYINNSKSTCKWCKKSVYCEKREQWELDYWKNMDPIAEVFFDVFNKGLSLEQEYEPQIDLYNCPDFCSPKCEYESKEAGN